MDPTDRGGYATSQEPLAGAVLCCTSIAPEQRAQLAAIGTQMGATIKLDLTSDVTHLIVGSVDSAKYRYVARSREDVRVLSPAWLEALRQVWLEGHDNVDVASLEKEYRLPTFCGLKICLTGFDNPDQRRYIQDTVDKNGAEYHGDLTKSVTHLIAATPSGKKYEHALNWRMKIVSLEWFEQSMERGMVLDELLYNPTMPVEERGQGAWERMQIPSPTLGKRTRIAEEGQPANPLRRKLRRSASTKVGSQSEALWAGITAPSRERQQIDDGWTEDEPAKPDTYQLDIPVKRVDQIRLEQPDVPHDCVPTPPPPMVHSHHGIFQGCIILLHGFDEEKTAILRDHLDSHGARVVDRSRLNSFASDELRQGYVVLPHDTNIDPTDLPDQARLGMTMVTNWWVERCLYGKHLFDPADHILSKPFDRLSISGFSDLIINSTGFVGIELLHVTKFVTLMGATYDEQLSAKTLVMICNSKSPNASKLKFALDKQIPAVHVAWLWECLHTGRVQPYGNFQIQTAASDESQRLKQKPTSLAEVPTAKLSEEDGLKLLHKKANKAERMTRLEREYETRGLDLAPSIDPLTLPNTNADQLGLDQPDPDLNGLDGPASLPIQDVRPNSPRLLSNPPTGFKSALRDRSSSTESLIKAVSAISKPGHEKENLSDSVIPQPISATTPDAEPAEKEEKEEKDYSDMLAQLRANRKATPVVKEPAIERRRRRQLGRATSKRSNQSVEDGSGQMSLNADDDDKTVLIEEYQPSQELGWDSPGAAKAREQMIKKLGGTIKDKSVPVEGIGVVKDVVSETSGRLGRKRRG